MGRGGGAAWATTFSTFSAGDFFGGGGGSGGWGARGVKGGGGDAFLALLQGVFEGRAALPRPECSHGGRCREQKNPAAQLEQAIAPADGPDAPLCPEGP